MLPPLPLLISAKIYVGLGLAALLFVRLFVVGARRRASRRVLGALAVATALAHLAWSVGLAHYPISYWGAAVTTASIPIATMLVLSMPVTALVRALLSRALLRTDHVPSIGAPVALPALSRRVFVQAVSTAIPLAAAGTGAAGFVLGDARTELRTVRTSIAGLHPHLVGLRILHLSDLHLGCTKGLVDLERLLARLEGPARPDVIVFTGDVAEVVGDLAPALRLASELRPRLGVFASLGNHEYLRGIDDTRPIYEKSPAELLVNRGARVRIGDAELYVAGVDDPVTLHRDIGPWLDRAVDTAFDAAPQGAFKLLLSHRPEGFVAGARRGAELTLSGHTHGGQIGYNGKSAFQPIWPDRYLWGSYARGRSHLYTTSGFGDWYPFRLGCPTEAPLIVLARSDQVHDETARFKPRRAAPAKMC